MQTKQPIPGLTAATCLRNAESKNECGFTWMEDCMSLVWCWICLVDTYTFHNIYIQCLYVYIYILHILCILHMHVFVFGVKFVDSISVHPSPSSSWVEETALASLTALAAQVGCELEDSVELFREVSRLLLSLLAVLDRRWRLLIRRWILVSISVHCKDKWKRTTRLVPPLCRSGCKFLTYFSRRWSRWHWNDLSDFGAAHFISFLVQVVGSGPELDLALSTRWPLWLAQLSCFWYF